MSSKSHFVESVTFSVAIVLGNGQNEELERAFEVQEPVADADVANASSMIILPWLMVDTAFL